MVSLREDSFFSGSHLKLTEIIEISYWWSKNEPVSRVVQETGHTQKTIIDWFNFHRDICTQYFLDHPIQIGGIGTTVEIDESKFGKRKYNRGRYTEGHWVFGGVERESGNGFMVEVADRTTQTLLPIIQKYIRPGTTVMSDEWRSYRRITSIGMVHETVNHSLNFVDPNTGAHTQNIESTWSKVKQMMRKKGVMQTSNDLFHSYLSEYLWRRKFKTVDPFNKILEHIKEQYPL